MLRPSCEILPRSFATILAALRNEDGSPRPVATAYLRDRVRIPPMTIDSGEITVTLLSSAPTDPLGCPTQGTTPRFRLAQGSLVESTPAR